MSTAEITTGDVADHQWDINMMDGILTPNTDVGKSGHQLVPDDHLTRDEKYGCRIFGYPRWLQSFASLKFFIVLLCLVIFLHALNLALFEGVLTTVEVRYQLSASQFGLTILLYTIGSVVSTIVVTHVGGRPTSRRPVWIGVCIVVSAFGTVLSTLPQFVFSPYQPQTSVLPMSSDGSNASEPPDGRCLLDAEYGEGESGLCESQDQQVLYENNIAFIIFAIGQLIIGLGYGPFIPLSLAYVNDNGSTETAALLSGLFESMYGVGAIVGFQVAAAELSLWVDFYRVDIASTVGLTPADQGWLGAWWLGYVILAVLYLAITLPLFGFPTRITNTLNDNSHIPQAENDSDDKVGQMETSTLKNLKEWPRTIWRLCKSPVFTLVSISFVCEYAILYSGVLFFPKYLQQQFGVDVSIANLITGFATFPAWAVGALVGGLAVKLLGLKMRGSVAMGTISSFVGCGICVALLFIGCDNQPIAGVTVGYQGSNLNIVDLKAACNSGCLCPAKAAFNPYCGSDGITYFSPCHAGCMEITNNETYNECSCLTGFMSPSPIDTDGDAPLSLTRGACTFNCSSLIAYIVISVLWTAVMGSVTAPRTVVIISSVNPADKSFAIGLSRVIALLVGSLPFPLLYGACIDSTCLVWQTLCGQRGACDIYDINTLRHLFFGLPSGLLLLQALSFLAIVFILRWRQETSK